MNATIQKVFYLLIALLCLNAIGLTDYSHADEISDGLVSLAHKMGKSLLKSGDPDKREAAALYFAKQSDNRLEVRKVEIDYLLKAFKKEKNSSVLENIGTALAQMTGYTATTDKMEEIIRSRSIGHPYSPEKRRIAINVLQSSHIHDKRMIDTLFFALSDPDEQVRFRATTTLSNMDSAEAHRRLADALKIREASPYAEQVLKGMNGDKTVTKRLLEILKQKASPPRARIAAAKILAHFVANSGKNKPKNIVDALIKLLRTERNKQVWNGLHQILLELFGPLRLEREGCPPTTPQTLVLSSEKRINLSDISAERGDPR